MAFIRPIVVLIVFALVSMPVSGAKPPKDPPAPAVAAPEVYSVKIDYNNGFIITEGQNLSAGTATATFGGVNLTVDGASTDSVLLFPFSNDLETAVDELGNYVLSITTDGGTFTLTAFVPFALAIVSEPPPPGDDCPCSPEWDAVTSSAPPNGVNGLMASCNEDTGNWVTVQFYDSSAYWVFWTEWIPSTNDGYCELWLDGPSRDLADQTEYEACADYLRNIVTVWGSEGQSCIF